MKQLLCVAAMALLTLSVFGQGAAIQQAEYYIDSSPLDGPGTPMSASDGAFDNLWEAFEEQVAALPQGLHTISIRVQDESGNWSPLFSTVLSVENPITSRSTRLNLAQVRWNSNAWQTMLVVDGTWDETVEAVAFNDLNTPGAGLHKLQIRVRGVDNIWSTPFTSVVSVEEPITARNTLIQQAEFWFDADDAIPLIAFDGNFNEAFETVMESGVATPASAGLHTLNMRVMGQDGNWSNTFSTILSIEEPITARETFVQQAEFWFDAEDAIPLLAFDGNFNEAFETVMESGIATPASPGLHTLNMRVMGQDGNWSNTFSTILSIEEPIIARNTFIQQAEFWFDAEDAIPLLAFDGNFNEAFETVMESGIATPASPGLHTLNMRVMGQDGNWSNTFSTILSIEEAITARNTFIQQAEFWFDSEDAIPLIAFDGNFNEAFEAVTGNGLATPVNPGLHTLNLRVMGEDGNWSNTFSSVITVEEPVTARDLGIQFAQVYFDNNPGNAFTLIAEDGAMGEAFESAMGQINSAVLSLGLHTIHYRVQGVDGQWSADFQSVIYIDPCTTSPVVTTTPSGTLNLCPNDSLELTATAGLSSYIWYKGAQEVGNTQSLWVYGPGYYYVVGYDEEGCPGASEGVWVNAVGTPALTVTANGPVEFCEGGSVSFTASGAFAGYTWNTGSNGAGLFVDSPGDYFVTAVSPAGCTVYSDTITVSVYDAPAAPVISYSGDLILCQGESLTLNSSYTEGNFWSNGLSTQSIEVSLPGTYLVTYTDAQGCSASSTSVQVQQSQVVALITPTDQVDLCDGQNVNIIASTGPGFEYQWLESGIAIPGEETALLNVSTAGIYSVVVSDALGCVDTSQTVTATVLPNPVATITPLGPTGFCSGGSVELQASAAAGWQWNTGATTQSIEVFASGSYQVLVTAENGCQALSDFTVVDVTSPLQSFTANPPIVWQPNTDVTFSAVTTGNIASYSWDFGDGNTSADPIPTHTYGNPGFYTATLTVVDESGCEATLVGNQLIEVWQVFPADPLGPLPGSITGISFLSTLVGCVTLADGTVLATTDGGLTWIDVTPPNSPGQLNDIILVGDANDNYAVVIGPGGYIAISENNGPWITPAIGISDDLNAVIPGPPGSGIIYAIGENGTVLCYQNGTWTNISYPGGSGISLGGGGYSNGVLYVLGQNGILYCWYGSSWVTVGSGFGTGGGGGGGGGSVGFGAGGGGPFGLGIGIIGGADGSIWTSPDGGLNWNQTYPGSPWPITDVVIVNENLIICAGEHGTILISEDGGNTWTEYSIGDLEDITGVEVDDCTGFFTGEDGGFYAFDIPGYVQEAPVLELSGALETCSTDLPSLAVINPKPGNTYVWSTGFVGTSLEISSSGIYWVTEFSTCDTLSSLTYEFVIEQAQSWHPDLDGDGFGDFYTEVIACESPGPEWILDDRDCFDDDPDLVLCCSGDFNNDGLRNTADLVYLLNTFGTDCGSPFCGGDINGDGITNTTDMVVLLGLFGVPCD